MMPFYYGSKVRSVPEYLGPPVRRRRPSAAGRAVRAGVGAARRREPVRDGDRRQCAARLADLARDRAGRRRGAALHLPRRPVRGDLQRGAAVLRHRRDDDPDDARRAAPGRRLARADRRSWRQPAPVPRSLDRRSPRTSSPVSAARSARCSASCSASASSPRSGTGRPTSPRCSARSPPRNVGRASAPRSSRRSRRSLIALVIVIPGMIAAVLVPGIAALQRGQPSNSPVQRRRPDAAARVAAQRLPRASPSPGCSPRSWPAWPPTSARSTPCSPTTSGRTGCARTGDDTYYLRIGPGGHGRRNRVGDRDGVHRRRVLQHHGLHPDAVLVLQRPAVRDLHPRPVLEADDRHGRVRRPRSRARSARWSCSSSTPPACSRSPGRGRASSAAASRSCSP